MPDHGVSSVALVGAQAQAVEFALGLQAEAAVLCVHLLVAPVLQLNQESVIILIGEHVDVFQSQPVLSINVPKSFLYKRRWEGAVSLVLRVC